MSLYATRLNFGHSNPPVLKRRPTGVGHWGCTDCDGTRPEQRYDFVELDRIASLDCALRPGLGRVSCTSIPLERFEAALNLPAEYIVVRKVAEGLQTLTQK